MALAVLADRIGATFKSHKTNSSVAEGWVAPGGAKLVLAKPNSFMNLSGGPVAALLKFYSLDASNLVVLHDELDLPVGRLKGKIGGGLAGTLPSITGSTKPHTENSVGRSRPSSRRWIRLVTGSPHAKCTSATTSGSREHGLLRSSASYLSCRSGT